MSNDSHTTPRGPPLLCFSARHCNCWSSSWFCLLQTFLYFSGYIMSSLRPPGPSTPSGFCLKKKLIFGLVFSMHYPSWRAVEANFQKWNKDMVLFFPAWAIRQFRFFCLSFPLFLVAVSSAIVLRHHGVSLLRFGALGPHHSMFSSGCSCYLPSFIRIFACHHHRRY